MSQNIPKPTPEQRRKTTRGTLVWIGGSIAAATVIGLMLAAIPQDETDSKAETASHEKATEAPKPEVTTKASEPEAEATSEAPEPIATTEAPKPKPKPKPKAVKVSAQAMLDEFEGNEAAADEKYKGKTVAVTGIVEKVDTEFWNRDEYVIQLADGSDFVLFTVNCNDVKRAVAATVEKGSKITVVGEFDDGGDLGVELKKCDVR